MKSVAAPLLALLALTACGSPVDSNLNATNTVNGKKIGHWYETLNFNVGDKKNFSQYFKNNPKLLSTDIDFLPESLKGLWYMDGNPLSDKTFSINNPTLIDARTGDISWPVSSPMGYSWMNTNASHTTISLIIKSRLEYELRWKDCPADVKAEREEKYGMADGGCLASDKEFAVVTPFVKVGPLRIRVPQALSYFDLYLRPKTSDHYIWERRSKVLGPVTGIAQIFAKDTASKGFHRYQFTQILDARGNQLSSFGKLQSDVEKLATKNGLKKTDDLLFLTCEEGREGCGFKEVDPAATSEMSEDEALQFGKVPLM